MAAACTCTCHGDVRRLTAENDRLKAKLKLIDDLDLVVRNIRRCSVECVDQLKRIAKRPDVGPPSGLAKMRLAAADAERDLNHWCEQADAVRTKVVMYNELIKLAEEEEAGAKAGQPDTPQEEEEAKSQKAVAQEKRPELEKLLLKGPSPIDKKNTETRSQEEAQEANKLAPEAGKSQDKDASRPRRRSEDEAELITSSWDDDLLPIDIDTDEDSSITYKSEDRNPISASGSVSEDSVEEVDYVKIGVNSLGTNANTSQNASTAISTNTTAHPILKPPQPFKIINVMYQPTASNQKTSQTTSSISLIASLPSSKPLPSSSATLSSTSRTFHSSSTTSSSTSTNFPSYSMSSAISSMFSATSSMSSASSSLSSTLRDPYRQRQRKCYSLSYKEAVLNHLKIHGNNISQTARIFGVNSRDVRRWQKEEGYLRMSLISQEAGGDRYRVIKRFMTTCGGKAKISTEVMAQLEVACLEFIKSFRLVNGQPPTNAEIQRYAVEKFNKINVDPSATFTGSNGWFHRFKMRNRSVFDDNVDGTTGNVSNTVNADGGAVEMIETIDIDEDEDD